MIYCAKCGTSNPEQSRFCRNCGNPLQMQTVQPPKPPQYAPKPSTGVSVALIVFMLLLLIVNIAAASDRSMDPDIDGVVLTVVYLLLSVAAFPILSFFKKQAKVASRNFHFAILLALFTVNTLLIPMWNGSLLLPYILLSVGLAVNTVIAWFRSPALASGRDSFLKKFHFVMAGIGGIMMLFSLLAFFNTHEWSSQDPTDSSYSRMTSSSFWGYRFESESIRLFGEDAPLCHNLYGISDDTFYLYRYVVDHTSEWECDSTAFYNSRSEARSGYYRYVTVGTLIFAALCAGFVFLGIRQKG